MDTRALRFLTAGFFPGLTRESARMTAVVFFDKYGTASDNPKVRAIAEGMSATMSDPIRKGVRTLLAMNESANRGAAGDTPASAQRALALFDQVKDYRIDRDGFWKDRLQTTLREIDGLIFDPHEHAQGLRARWQWPGPASKTAAKDKDASGNPVVKPLYANVLKGGFLEYPNRPGLPKLLRPGAWRAARHPGPRPPGSRPWRWPWPATARRTSTARFLPCATTRSS